MKPLVVAIICLLAMACMSARPIICEKDSLNQHFQDVEQTIYQIYTSTTLKENDNALPLVTGRAFAINQHQLLTAGHVVKQDCYYVSSPFGNIAIDITEEEKKEEKSWIIIDGKEIPVTVTYKNKDLDFAVLETNQPIKMPLYTIGKSDQYNILDPVFFVGNNQIKYIKSGHIMSLDYIPCFIQEFDLGISQEDLVGLYMSIKNGDSGSPIFIINDSEISVIGIVLLSDGNGTGYIRKIDAIIDDFRSWQNEREL